MINDAAGNHLLDDDGVKDGWLTLDRSQGSTSQDFFCFFGDSDGDTDVDLLDLYSFRSSYMRLYPDPLYNSIFDIDDDGDIDFIDSFHFRNNYQKILPNEDAL